MSSAPAIGIDLGTTFSGAAVYRNGKTEVIPNKEGQRLTPSFIYYHPDSLAVSVGTTADDLGPQKIDNFLFDIKRLIGRKYDDVYVQKLKKSEEYRFNIVKGEEDKAEIELLHDGENVKITPEQASSEILKYLRESASEYLGTAVTEAVISVPAHFSNAQRKATRAAAELAGLKVLKLITEPVAAAIHFVEDRLKTKASLLVFDFGGGTLDVSIIEVDGKTFKVKSVEGDTFLGGRDFDQILLEHFKAEMVRKFGSSIFNDRLLRRVKNSCIRLKTKLSTENKYSLPIYCIGGVEERNFDLSLTRLEFQNLTDDLYKRALNLVETCLKEVGMSQRDIGEVVLVGGTTRIPKVRNILESYFSGTVIRTDLNPDEAVALGASMQAALIKEKCQELEVYKITEITPLSLGLGLSKDLMVAVINKNTALPFKSEPVNIVTVDNDQDSITFKVFEGERKNCKFNNSLGSFEISGLLHGRAGEVDLDVVFCLNEDGILEVTATEKCSGKNNNLVVTIGEFRLCDYKVRHVIGDAEKNKKDDDIFEAFVRYFWKVRRICNHIIYDLDKILPMTDREFVKNKCEQFQDTIKKLKHTEIDKLREEYEMFRKSVKGLLENNNINVQHFIDDEPRSSNFESLLRSLRLDLDNQFSNNSLVKLSSKTKGKEKALLKLK